MPVCTISLTRTLTLGASSTAIDGYTQPGSSPDTSSIGGAQDNAIVTIHLDGSSMFAGGIALSNANGDTIRGLSLTNFHNGPALATSKTNDTLIVGNLIGVGPDGTVQGNAEGIRISQAHNTTIGGSTPDSRNWVSGSAGFGVAVSQYGLGVTVQGNLITGNGTSGVGIGVDAQGIPIPVAIRQNIITGNRGLGIDVFPGGVSNCLALVHYASHFTPCPVIRKATAKAVSGTACKKCVVEVYIASAETKDKGFGEGKGFLGTVVATKGTWQLSLAGKHFDPKRQQITATATTNSQTPTTSEFALNMPSRFRFQTLNARYSVARGRVTAVRATWQMASQVGVAGFDLYASAHRLNGALIRIASARKYSFAARLSSRPQGGIILAVKLENGVQVKVLLRPTG